MALAGCNTTTVMFIIEKRYNRMHGNIMYTFINGNVCEGECKDGEHNENKRMEKVTRGAQ